MKHLPYLGLAALALLVTLLNAAKPIAIDDPAYYDYAAHIAEHPLDPYGFVFWGNVPAMELLAPPGLLYWWAGAMRLFGDNLFLCKLSLFPFGFLWAVSLFALFRRFSPGWEGKLTAATCLSPAVLPCWNFMLDLPSLALSLAAIVVFARAADRRSWGGALLAGLVAGLAMQTKYTALVGPAVILWYGLLHRRVAFALLSAAVAAGLFVSWEVWLLHTYGQSHFLVHLGQRSGGNLLLRKVRLLGPMVAAMGGVAPWLAVLGVGVLGGGRRTRLLAGLAVAALFVAVVAIPESAQALARGGPRNAVRLHLGSILFAVAGVGVCGVLLFIAWRLVRDRIDTSSRQDDWFLLGWLGLEVMASLALSPYPAVRRILGVLVVATLLVGRGASRMAREPATRPKFAGALVLCVVLGLAYYAVDLREAVAQRRAAEWAVRHVQLRDPSARVWCSGWWGFFHYARRSGAHQLGRDSRPADGDWILTDGNAPLEAILRGRPREEIAVSDPLPLRTAMNYHASGTPLRRDDGPRFVVAVYGPRERP